jgi:hypothetical protein
VLLQPNKARARYNTDVYYLGALLADALCSSNTSCLVIVNSKLSARNRPMRRLWSWKEHLFAPQECTISLRQRITGCSVECSSPCTGSSSPICRRLKYPKRTGASAREDEQGWGWSLKDAGKEARGVCMCFIRQFNASNHQMCFMRVCGRLSRNLRGQNAGTARKLRLMLELAALPSQGG